jgi:hypothetical protein
MNIRHHNSVVSFKRETIIGSTYKRHRPFNMGTSQHSKTQCDVKVNFSLYFFLTERHALKAYWGSGSIASRILDLGTRFR